MIENVISERSGEYFVPLRCLILLLLTYAILLVSLMVRYTLYSLPDQFQNYVHRRTIGWGCQQS